jgi:alpha-ribazole phosphatase
VVSVRLLLVRHGETVWNANQRYQGQCDVPLSPEGRRQARQLRERLRRETVHAVYASDLSRARETAEIILEGSGVAPTLVSELREMSFGAWEGMRHDEIEAAYPEQLRAWIADPVNVAPPGGETLASLFERSVAVLGRVTSGHDGQTVLVVAHGGPLRMILCHLLEVRPELYWRLGLRPASLTAVDLYPEGAIVGVLNDTCHLDGWWHESS